ncbi:MAG: hypothetical protein WC873_01055 [Candidatus Gracilibacteria bacterium]
MLEHLPDRLDGREILSRFKDQRHCDEQKKPDPTKEVIHTSLSQKNLVDATKKTAQTIVSKFLQIDKNTPGAKVKENPGRALRWSPVHVEVLDPSVPLTLVAMKSIDLEGSLRAETIHFHLFKTAVTGNSPEEIYKSYITLLANQTTEIGSINFSFRGNGRAQNYHRIVYQRFLNQPNGIKFSEILMKAGESFVSAYAREKQETQTAEFTAGQIDAICWLWNNGYRPEGPEDEEKFQKILETNTNLIVGENLYVFDSKIKKKDRTKENFRDSLRIKFVKKFQPPTHQDAETLIKTTHDQATAI